MSSKLANVLYGLYGLASVAVYFAVVHPAAWTALNAFTCSGINGNIGFFFSSCTCVGPLTGRQCQDCACKNNGTCSVSGGVTTCACPDAWGGSLCNICSGIQNGTLCRFPCQPPYYADTVGSCTRFCNASTTCNNSGTCNPTTGRCDCFAKSNFYTDPNQLLTNDQLQCRQSCNCQNGGFCTSKTQTGCTCPTGVGGPTCNLVCPNRCSNQGLCVPKSAQDPLSPRCQCFKGFVGAHCQHKCPQQSGVVCGGIQNQCVPPDNDDDQDNSAARCRCQQNDGTFVTVQGNCNTFCANNGVFDPKKLACVCPVQFTSASRCLRCSPGFLGPGCSVHCKQDMCSGRGQCIVNADPAACECFGAGNGQFNGTLVASVQNTKDTGSHARGNKVVITTDLVSVDAAQHTLQVDVRVNAHGITIAHVPCFESQCVLDNVGEVALGPVSRESDVPLSFFDTALKVGRYCNASLTLGARATCLARPLCHAYNAEANVVFDCYGKQCVGDALDSNECDGISNFNPMLDAYLQFSISDIKPRNLAVPDIIIPTPSPTPFATAAPTPLSSVRFVSTGFTDLDTAEARIVCPRLCLSVPNGTGWAGAFRQPDPTQSNPHPSMQCACDIASITQAPTPFPTRFPTPLPTPAPTVAFSVRHMLGLPVVTNALSLESERPIDIPEIRQAMQDFINPNIEVQPLVMYMTCRRRTAFVTVSIGDLNAQFTSFDDVTPTGIATALNNIVRNACPDVHFTLHEIGGNSLRVQHVTLSSSIPVINSANFRLLVRAGDTVPPPVSVTSFDIKAVVLAEQGCNRCAQNYYPSPDVVASLSLSVRPCTVHCQANTTCHGNGRCNEEGQCVCDTRFGQVWAKGTNCATCAIHFYPRPSQHDHITQAANQVPWCTSFCNPNMDITDIRSNVLAQFVPAGFEAAVIGCSGHGECANGLNLTLGSPVPPVRCVCDVAGANGKEHGFRGQFCQSSCGTQQGGPICSGHGTCRTGISCDCDDGFFGPSCEFTCSAQVFYKNSETGVVEASKCNAFNSAQGGTCQAVDRYVHPLNGAQITQQLCWLDGKIDEGGNPNGAAAAQCCGLPEDTQPDDDAYRRHCNDTVRLQAGVFCNATTNAVPGYCQRAKCECHGSLAGEACDLSGCPSAVTGTQGFSACGSALEIGECQHGECVPEVSSGLQPRIGQSASNPYVFDPNKGFSSVSTQGVCACHHQPLTSELCQTMLETKNTSYSATCCPGAVSVQSSTTEFGLEVYHGPACSVDCACARQSTGTCSSASGVPGEQAAPKPCQCRRTSEKTDLFCGDGCTRTCPGVSATMLQLQPFCANVAFNSPGVTANCYDMSEMQAPGSPLANSSLAACSGHGTCVQSNCACQCLGFTTSTVYGAVYNTMQLFNGPACEFTCPGVTESLVNMARDIENRDNSLTSIERSVLLNTFATEYQNQVCSGHGFCGTEFPGCTCVGGYTGATCNKLGCTEGSTALSLTPDAQTEIDDYGFRVCGRGTCSDNKCVCNSPTRFNATGTLWQELKLANKAEPFQKFQRLLDVPCLKCADNMYSSRFQYSLLDVHAHLPGQVMMMLGGSLCDTHIPTVDFGCCKQSLVQDADAIVDGLQHAGCPGGQCELNVQTGAACTDCLLGLGLSTDSDCAKRCSVCSAAASVLPVAADAISSQLALAEGTPGCAQCVGAGSNALNPVLMPLDGVSERTVCSGHGQCIGDTSTWHGSASSQAANVITPVDANDRSNTTLCRCEDGFAGALCGKVTNVLRCTQGGDSEAKLLLPEGLCVCSDYSKFGGPWCDKLAVNANLFISPLPTFQKDSNGDPIRAPPRIVAVNGEVVLCNNRGVLATCKFGRDDNDVRFCKAAFGSKPEPPCRCIDPKFDPEMNCLDFTLQQHNQHVADANNLFAQFTTLQ